MTDTAIPLPEDGERLLAEQVEPLLRLLREIGDRLATHDQSDPAHDHVKEN